uniref:Uncharacterized protein n=1 Tax=Sus scrofa TaxID=9823 RepID=A0A8D0ZN60_PIG
MAHIHLLLAGVILSSTAAGTLGQFSGIHRLENREIFMLLRQMKRTSSQACLKDRTDFQFPWKGGKTTRTQTSQGTCFHPLMLQQIINLFNTENSRAAWNNALLDHLLSRLDHGLDRLEQMEGDNLACAYLGSVVRKYFQRIHRYLQEKSYSPCAWEIIRAEVISCKTTLQRNSKKKKQKQKQKL